MNWFIKTKLFGFNKVVDKKKCDEWLRCSNCKSFLLKKKVFLNLNICYKCNFHFNMSSRYRAYKIFDSNTFFELSNNFLPVDPLNFFDTKFYYSRIAENQIITKEFESLLIFKGRVKSIDVVICFFEFNFIGGSMGRIAGDKFTYAVNFSVKYKLPLICFSSSGGARMQESLYSLMQMAKVSYSLTLLSKVKIPYISVMINPCMGGVSASLAMLGDVNVAEPGALIGFTGPRVIKDMLKIKIPQNFQKSESLLSKGFLDFIINRKFLRNKIATILKTFFVN